jgi:hypothetical protein
MTLMRYSQCPIDSTTVSSVARRKRTPQIKESRRTTLHGASAPPAYNCSAETKRNSPTQLRTGNSQWKKIRRTVRNSPQTKASFSKVSDPYNVVKQCNGEEYSAVYKSLMVIHQEKKRT